MDKLVRQQEIEFVIAHGRWTFDWCTQDKQLHFLGNRHISLSLVNKTCLYIYIYIYIYICMYLLKKREIWIGSF